MPSKISVRLPGGEWIEFRERGRCSVDVWRDELKDLKIGDVVELWNNKGIFEGRAKLAERHPVTNPQSWYQYLRDVLVFAKVEVEKPKNK